MTTVGGASSRAIGAVVAPRPVIRRKPLAFIETPSIGPGPNEHAPLVALVRCATNRPARASLEIFDGRSVRVVRFQSEPARRHELPVLGLRAGRRHRLRVVLNDAGGGDPLVSRPLEWSAPALPPDFPRMHLTASQPERMEPGVTIFGPFQWTNDKPNLFFGLIIFVNNHGEVVWYRETEFPVADMRRLANGNLLCQHGNNSVVSEFDMLGNLVRRWHAAGRKREDHHLADSIPLDVDTLHHEVTELPGGNLLGIATEVRRIGRYRTSDLDRTAPRRVANVIGDVLVEFTREGEIVRRWKLLDILQAHRLGYGSLTGFWDIRGYEDVPGGTRDWSHANAVVYDARDDSMIVSVRHQDAIVKIDRAGGGLKWILANPEGWGAGWRKHLLRPEGQLRWPYHQHGPSLTPDGALLVYDNRNYQASPFEPPVPAPQNRSRVVEFRIDEEAMTVEQVWEYDGGDEPFYSTFFGDADVLPQTGNVLICDGGRIYDELGRPSDDVPSDYQWARILEVTRRNGSVKVFEMRIDEGPAAAVGWSVYRAQRLPSVYPPTMGTVEVVMDDR